LDAGRQKRDFVPDGFRPSEMKVMNYGPTSHLVPDLFNLNRVFTSIMKVNIIL
jgi:hypothetical protein